MSGQPDDQNGEVPAAGELARRRLPLAHLLDGMRQALIFGHGLGAIWPDVRNLVGWLAIGLLLVAGDVPLRTRLSRVGCGAMLR